MVLNISEISEYEGLTVDHLYPEGEPRLRSEDTRILGRPALAARVTRAGLEVKLAGTVTATVQISCDRCLSPITVSVEERFRLSYVPPLRSRREDEERELAEDDLTVGFYQGELIDLDDLVREQIELALPMSRLCREDCRGFCPRCGANLNDGDCGCSVDDIDPRWEALRQLKLQN